MPSLVQKFPSKITRNYWIYAKRKIGQYPQHTVHGGKWLIFVSSHNIDRIWIKIKTALENGHLSGIAKAATAKSAGGLPNSKAKLICVYTYDQRDEQDVKKIREELRKIGITRKIAYKADEDTDLGRYRTNTGEKLSKYYE